MSAAIMMLLNPLLKFQWILIASVLTATDLYLMESEEYLSSHIKTSKEESR